MKKLSLIAGLLMVAATLTACTGSRGVIGGQEVCTNDYLLGVISISELVAPCSK